MCVNKGTSLRGSPSIVDHYGCPSLSSTLQRWSCSGVGIRKTIRELSDLSSQYGMCSFHSTPVWYGTGMYLYLTHKPPVPLPSLHLVSNMSLSQGVNREGTVGDSHYTLVPYDHFLSPSTSHVFSCIR